MAVDASSHQVLKFVNPDKGCPIHAGELRALIRMDQHPLLRLATPYRHVQRLQHHIGGLPALYRSTHHATGIEVDHDSQIGKAFQDANVCDVRHPGQVGGGEVELAIQSFVDRQGWLATMAPGPTLVADLRLDTRQPAQPGNAVRGMHSVKAADQAASR